MWAVWLLWRGGAGRGRAFLLSAQRLLAFALDEATMDEETYRVLNLDIRMDQKEPTSGMRNLNTGEELKFADPTGEDAEYQPAPQCQARSPGV